MAVKGFVDNLRGKIEFVSSDYADLKDVVPYSFAQVVRRFKDTISGLEVKEYRVIVKAKLYYWVTRPARKAKRHYFLTHGKHGLKRPKKK